MSFFFFWWLAYLVFIVVVHTLARRGIDATVAAKQEAGVADAARLAGRLAAGLGMLAGRKAGAGLVVGIEGATH